VPYLHDIEPLKNAVLPNLKSFVAQCRADRFFVLCLAACPVLTLALRGWAGGCLFLAFLLALVMLAGGHGAAKVDPFWLRALLCTLAAPVAAVALGQIFRHEWSAPAYDSASRFLLAAPVALVIARNGVNFYKLLGFAAPAGIFVTALSVLSQSSFKYVTGDLDRVSTYFVDPLTFGSVCLALALISLVSIDAAGKDSWWLRAVKLAAFFCGLYLSLVSGSRTGWLALPVILWLWLRFRMSLPHWKIGTLVGAFCAAVYLLVPVAAMRIDLALDQLLHYRWDGLNQYQSVGSRVAFIRIGWFVFAHNPLGGWGDTGFRHLLDAPELLRFADETTRHMPYHAGFHNEIVTNMVRSGIWGLVSSVALFAMPLALFVKGLHMSSARLRNHALIGIGYVICILVSGMSTEVFNLKFAAAFHALMFSGLCASFLALAAAERADS
jgi:O-antigen ligase